MYLSNLYLKNCQEEYTLNLVKSLFLFLSLLTFFLSNALSQYPLFSLSISLLLPLSYLSVGLQAERLFRYQEYKSRLNRLNIKVVVSWLFSKARQKSLSILFLAFSLCISYTGNISLVQKKKRFTTDLSRSMC